MITILYNQVFPTLNILAALFSIGCILLTFHRYRYVPNSVAYMAPSLVACAVAYVLFLLGVLPEPFVILRPALLALLPGPGVMLLPGLMVGHGNKS